MQDRTGGDIYIGVVGPVRTGKSTFIAKMMEHLVLPGVSDENIRARMIDELPQSSQGQTIMTTQPKFVPDRAVSVNIDDIAELRIRMMDCVGYMVPGAQGSMEDGSPRMVRTPWFDYDIPFEQAAEIGTRKVITDHSTIGIVMTTDGSIAQIPRENYISAEEKVICELRELGKPFVIILNSANPGSDAAKALQKELSEKYAATVLLMDVLHFTKQDIEQLLSDILYEFPVKSIEFNVAKWILALPKDHPILSDLIEKIDKATAETVHMRDYEKLSAPIAESEYVTACIPENIALGSGCISIGVRIDDGLFYRVLGEECGCEIRDERHLFSITKELVHAKKHYDRLKNAISTVKQTGYGIVSPTLSDLSIEEPELFEQAGKFGVRIHAGAPTLHMIRVDVETDVSPIIGSEAQANDFITYLLKDPDSMWETDIFGKSLSEIVTDSLRSKVQNIPDTARDKLQNTLERVVNEGDGGMLFILL
ncbi:MAG: stage IV sporulation protein A [Christensenellaceae bacterium]|nr:stage IV sporulation protein A [Christensenellaceae bacterium]